MSVRKLEFDPVLRKNHVDLGKCGDFYGDHVLFDPDYPDRFTAVGTIETYPKHAENGITLKNAEIDIDIDTFIGDFDLDKEVGENPTAEHLFALPWAGWHTDDIPAEWEY